MKLQNAELIAKNLVDQLSPFCQKIFVAGSVRRKAPQVKDIELVVQPKTQSLVKDLFTRETETRIHDGFAAAIQKMGHIKKGKPGGRYIQVMLPAYNILEDPIQVDIFVPQPHDFFRILAIRTGSADYSHRVIAKAWFEKGWCGTSDGLRQAIDCERRGKAGTWTVVAENPVLPPVWTSEAEFFQWLGIPMPEPCDRVVDLKKIDSPPYNIQALIDAGEFTPVPEV